MSDVFIAHVEEDADVALEIALGLEEAGYTTWCYEIDSIPGPSYLIQTGKAVEQAKAVVVVISPHSVGSYQVTKEVVRAHESRKQFVPVLRGITHIEFQNRQPEWREAIGAATSITIPVEGVADILPQIISGLKNLGVPPSLKTEAAHMERIRKARDKLRRGGILEKGREPPTTKTPEKASERQKWTRLTLLAAAVIVMCVVAVIFLIWPEEPPPSPTPSPTPAVQPPPSPSTTPTPASPAPTATPRPTLTPAPTPSPTPTLTPSPSPAPVPPPPQPEPPPQGPPTPNPGTGDSFDSPLLIELGEKVPIELDTPTEIAQKATKTVYLYLTGVKPGQKLVVEGEVSEIKDAYMHNYKISLDNEDREQLASDRITGIGSCTLEWLASSQKASYWFFIRLEVEAMTTLQLGGEGPGQVKSELQYWVEDCFDAGLGIDAGAGFKTACEISPGTYEGYLAGKGLITSYGNDESDYYLVGIKSGEELSLGLTPESEACISLTLYDYNRNKIKEVSPKNPGEIVDISWTAPQSQYVYIVVSWPQLVGIGGGAMVEYTLSAEVN